MQAQVGLDVWVLQHAGLSPVLCTHCLDCFQIQLGRALQQRWMSADVVLRVVEAWNVRRVVDL